MNSRSIIKLLAIFVLASMILVACGGGAATEAPAEEPAAEEPAAEEPAAEEPAAEEPMEEEMAFEGLSVAAADCDYGGKIGSIEATGQYEVTFNLCSADPAFLEKIAFTPFGIQPEEYIASTGGTGALLEAPIGTGPYQVQEWVRGEQVIYTRFDDYWGEAPAAETAILRWATESAARLQELQAGTADMITSVNPDDQVVIEADPNLVLLPDANPNIFYIGFTNNFAPFDDVEVRKAIAMGIDRQRIVDTFYPAGSEVASHFTPCSIPNGCAGESWYDFDLDAARQALADAGYPDGFETKIFYRDVTRTYLPQVSSVAQDIQAQFADLGITAEVVVMESGEFIAEASAGNLDGIHLLGWGADYPHITNFLDFHFGEANTQFGASYPEVYTHLQEGSKIGDVAVAAPIYEAANNAIKEVVPMIPVAHSAASDAAQASLGGAYTPPFGATQFQFLDPGKDTLVFVQNAEPISLYCADETDGESLTPCQQVVETLLEYGQDSGLTQPELATSCEANDDLSVWTCTLREGVSFHDGSSFDANDVIASWAAGIDAESPYHVGNTGTFFYYEYLWDSFINPASE